MIPRKIQKCLMAWKVKTNRKPLILRGARQTGKTTAIREFSKEFDSFIELNFEQDAVRAIFKTVRPVSEIVQSIEVFCGKKITPQNTILFFDEIQNEPNAIKLLRYFFEEIPHLAVIAAGSLLEVRMKAQGWSFPVGRVEFLYLYPLNFEEFLEALGEHVVLDYLKKDYFKKPDQTIHQKLMSLVLDYMTVGGMPEVVREYADQRSFLTVRDVQKNLLATIREDFSKHYQHTQVAYLKSIWDQLPFLAGQRIKYTQLADQGQKTVYVSQAFEVLHDAMLAERVWPTTLFQPPLQKKQKAAAKVFLFDVGLTTSVLNISRDQLTANALQAKTLGGLSESFVFQELLALDERDRQDMYFWVRQEKDALAETDFLFAVQNTILPVEVKHAPHGALKSMHEYLVRSGEKRGIRICAGVTSRESLSVVRANQDLLEYELLTVPFYRVFLLKQMLQALG